jgi:Nitrogen regulatory protein P-II
MKLLTIIYDSSIEDSMIQLVEDLEVPGFTRFTDLQGRGGRGPKQLNPIFPGSNNVLLAAMPDEQAERVRRAIRRLQSSFRIKPGVTILCQAVEELP